MAENSKRRDLLNSALSLHRQGKLRAALDTYRRYLSVVPDHPEVWNLAAEAAFGVKDFEAAANLLERVARAQPQKAQAHFNLALVLKELGRLDAATESLHTAVGLQPDYAAAQFQLGTVLAQLGRREAAVEAFERSIALDPHNVEALSNCAVLLKELRRFNDSLARHRRALEVRPDHAGLNYNYGLALETTERFEQAAASFRTATELDPGFALAHSSLARTLGRLGRHEDSVASYRRALALSSTSAELYSRLGLALHANGAFEEALEMHKRAIGLSPQSEECYCALGESLSAAERHTEAVEAFERALALKPDYHEAIAKKQLALEELGRAGEVVADLRQALKQRPDDADLEMSLARSLLQSGDADACLVVCDRCLDRRPGLTTALAYRALALRELDRNTESAGLVDLERLILPQVLSRPAGFASLEAFNSALAQHVLNHPTLMRDPPGHATKSGRHTGELLIEPKGPVAVLEKAINLAVRRYMKTHPKTAAHPFLARQPDRWTLNIWSVVLEAQGHQIPHIHPAAWLSGVYYVKVPGIVGRSGNEHAGWIEFGSPATNLNCAAPPEIRDIRPEEGLMVLFPAYFYHRTLPFDTDEMRISVAFDILPFNEA